MGTEKEVAIYHPYIDLSDAGLIKTAALYWDELQTIVPQSISEPYEMQVSKEAYSIGFLKPRIVNPEDNSVLKAGKEFAEDIQQTTVRKNVVAVFRKSKRKRFIPIHIDKWAPQHLMKIWYVLHEEVPLSPDYSIEHLGDSIDFPAPLGNAYMSRLASVIAQYDKTVPLTNLPDFQDILSDRFLDYSDEHRRNQSQLATMSLKTISIEPETPLIEILRFKDKHEHREMLLNFRRYIRELARQVATGLDTTEKQCVFEEIIKDKILPVKEEIESKLSEDDITFGLSAFDIAQATVMGAFASGGTDWRTGIAGAGISLTVSLYQSLREDRTFIRDHPLGYLYKAQKKFGQNR